MSINIFVYGFFIIVIITSIIFFVWQRKFVRDSVISREGYITSPKSCSKRADYAAQPNTSLCPSGICSLQTMELAYDNELSTNGVGPSLFDNFNDRCQNTVRPEDENNHIPNTCYDIDLNKPNNAIAYEMEIPPHLFSHTEVDMPIEHAVTQESEMNNILQEDDGNKRWSEMNVRRGHRLHQQKVMAARPKQSIYGRFFRDQMGYFEHANQWQDPFPHM